ncbi:MAG TPA: hypothetical protein VNL70_01125 [Tepidisphaeraceae bacterium]|nr:hypothetical protein [Tepidisphaeraceae bacterium]
MTDQPQNRVRRRWGQIVNIAFEVLLVLLILAIAAAILSPALL